MWNDLINECIFSLSMRGGRGVGVVSVVLVPGWWCCWWQSLEGVGRRCGLGFVYISSDRWAIEEAYSRQIQQRCRLAAATAGIVPACGKIWVAIGGSLSWHCWVSWMIWFRTRDKLVGRHVQVGLLIWWSKIHLSRWDLVWIVATLDIVFCRGQVDTNNLIWWILYLVCVCVWGCGGL